MATGTRDETGARNADPRSGDGHPTQISGNGKSIAAPRNVRGASWRMRARRSGDAPDAQSIESVIADPIDPVRSP